MDSKIPLFNVEYILEHFDSDLVNLSEGEILFNEGGSNDFVYYIVSGSIKVSRKKWTIGITYPKEFVGITSCISEGDNYTFSARSLETSQVLRIRKENFKEVLLNNPTFSKFIIEILCERIKLTDLKTTSFLELPPERRIVIELLNNLKAVQDKFIAQISLKDLSELTGVSMRSVKKLIEKFTEDGILEIAKSHQIILLDKQRLERIIDLAS